MLQLLKGNEIMLYYICFIIYTGLGFRPMPPTENVESTLIWYKGTDNENFKHWVDSLQNFLKGNHP